jgi:hypothetical protein
MAHRTTLKYFYVPSEGCSGIVGTAAAAAAGALLLRMHACTATSFDRQQVNVAYD